MSISMMIGGGYIFTAIDGTQLECKSWSELKATVIRVALFTNNGYMKDDIAFISSGERRGGLRFV